MLTRRALLGSAAMLTAGCGFLKSRFSSPALSKVKPIKWAVTWVSDEELPWLAEQLLKKDEENPHGPKRGGYTLSRQEVGVLFNTEDLIDTLQEMQADLVNVNTFNVAELAGSGVLLPLEGFRGMDEKTLNQEFFPSVLDRFRIGGSQFALPLNARPLMMHYDAALFAEEGVPPPDGTWDWQDLVDNAVRLTQRDNDGKVKRWGLVAHNLGIWWALLQNEAAVVDPATGECGLDEPAAIAALAYIKGLIHTQRVSPAATGRALWDNMYINRVPPAMVHSQSAKPSLGIRLGELPQGKAQIVPVEAEMGMAILARSSHPDVAYAALRGLVEIMQELVAIPAKRETVARLGEYKVGLEEEDIAIVQRSMEHGTGVSRFGLTGRTLERALQALVRDDDVTTAVNDACTYLHLRR